MARDHCTGYEDDDTAVVSFYHCKRCGRDYEIAEPCEEERNGEYSSYWNGTE